MRVDSMRAKLPYVIVVALDFSKAFDTVRHSSVMAKVAQLNLPDYVHNWLANYLEGHCHCTRKCRMYLRSTLLSFRVPP